jgi:hypothetical protein
MTRLVVLMSMVLQGTAFAQQAQTARIAGQVIDEASAPIVDARVTLMMSGRPMGGPPPEARTDSNGRFLFDQLEAGVYRVQVMKGGFAQAPQNALVGTIEVKAGGSVDDVKLALQRGGAIAGRVLDAKGEPIVEVRVTAQRPTVNGQMAMLTMAGQMAQTNDLGEYRIYGLPAGEYYVQAGGFMGMPPTAPVTSRLAATFFPDAREPRNAKPVTVAAGRTASDVNIRMEMESLFQIRGIVVDDKGQPVEGAMISVTADRMNPGTPPVMPPMNRISTQRDGSFVIVNLPSGGYTITAAQPLILSTQTPGSGAGGFVSTGVSGTAGGGFGGAGVMTSTEMRNGVMTTYQYRNDSTKSVRVEIANANLTGVKVVAASPPAKP